MKVFDDEDDCYFPSFYNIYINSSNSLNGIFGSDKESELFHEYLHFWQDITTTYGLVNSSRILNKIKDVYHYIKDSINKGVTNFKLPISGVSREATQINSNLFTHYLAYKDTEEIPDAELLYEPEEEIVKYTLPDGTIIDVSTWEITTTDLDKFKFGAHAIMEGICHNLQKEVYGDVETVKKVPYNLSKMIWDFMLPEYKDNIKAFLELSEFSLMHLMSGHIFIFAIKQIQAGQLDIDDDFYMTLCKNFTVGAISEDTTDVFTEFDNKFNDLINDIDGTFTSPLYEQFVRWLKRMLDIGHSYRLQKKSLFAELLVLKQKTPDKRTQWLKNKFNNSGYPPVRNAEGQIFCDVVKGNYFDYISRLSSIAMYSAYDCLVNPNFQGCTLKESCIHLQDQDPSLTLVDDDCTNQPWKKTIEPNMCPFIAVWKTWGLTNLNFSRE